MSKHLRTTTTPMEASIVVAICVGWAIASSTRSVAAGFQPGEFNNGALRSIAFTEVMADIVPFL